MNNPTYTTERERTAYAIESAHYLRVAMKYETLRSEDPTNGKANAWRLCADANNERARAFATLASTSQENIHNG